MIKVSKCKTDKGYDKSKRYIENTEKFSPKVIIQSCTFLPIEDQNTFIQNAFGVR